MIRSSRAFITLAVFAVPCLGQEPSASVRTAILIADAEKLFREGKPREAVARYDKASARAFGEGAVGKAFELSRTAAAVMQSIGERDLAAERLRRLALANAVHPEAPDAYRTAIVCLAQSVASDPARGTAYAAAMSEFLEQWPAHDSCDQVRWWLAKWQVVSGQWTAAREALDATPPESPYYVQALRLQGDAGVGMLGGHAGRGPTQREQDALVSQFTKALQPIVTGTDNRWPAKWTPAQRAAALSLARVHLEHSAKNARYAYRILTAAAVGQPQPDARWREESAPVLVQAAVLSGDYKGSLDWIGRLPDSAAERCQGLAGVLERAAIDGNEPASAGKVLLALTQRLAHAPQPWAPRARAIGLLATGEHRAAIAPLRALAQKAPDDSLLSLALALALSQQPEEESLEEALRLWTRIEQRTRSGTPEWQRARAARIELLRAAGQPEQADKLRRLTELLSPGALSPRQPSPSGGG